MRPLPVPEPRGTVVGHIPRELVDVGLTARLYERFGIGDLAAIEAAEDRVTELSAASTVVCPMHQRRLVPDACRSCRFLAGEVRS